MIPKNPRWQRIVSAALVWAVLAGNAPAWAFPVDDAFPLPQSEPGTFLYEHPRATVPESEYISLHPGRVPGINQPHPYPKYLEKFIKKEKFPFYYKELLSVPPENQIQSKVFDALAFSRVRIIGVVDFENKIPEPFKDDSVGPLIARQIVQELENTRAYTVVPPKRMVKTHQIEITKSTDAAPPKKEAGSPPSAQKTAKKGYDLPYSSDKIDAVLIGAVTRFSEHYIDRNGKKVPSLSAAVEFGAFLVSTKTGKVIWGARYVGSQSPSLMNLFNGKYRWLSKQELSEYGIQRIILKHFRSQTLTR